MYTTVKRVYSGSAGVITVLINNLMGRRGAVGSASDS